MPPPPRDTVPKAAKPQHAASFDPWNSSSTGHQRPDQRPGIGWRDSRNIKLDSQFRVGSSGGERRSDTWGAGAEEWDGEHKILVPKAVRERATRSVRDMLAQSGKMRESLGKGDVTKEAAEKDALTAEEALAERRRLEDEHRQAEKSTGGIFRGVVVYVNGSTFPLVSDHKLKHILVENGGQMSSHLGRRRVTHVVLGRPAGSGKGSGGGLAGGKLDKEIRRVGGCGIKYVGAEWILESLKAGKRLPEAQFSTTKVAPKAQGSVLSLFSKKPTNER